MPATGDVAPEILQQIVQAIRSLRYGTVQVTVHDARVVQIEKVEKTRLVPPTDLTPGRPTFARRPTGSPEASGTHGC